MNKQSLFRYSINMCENKRKIECTCPLCRKGSYNSADYYVDMSFLAKERPIGVSGLLRVKNDAEFLSDCIDSCVDALDELIICYQDCEDNAPEIIREKQKQYPHKIKVYYYAPPVYCWGLTDEEKNYAFSLPDSSIHKLCNYYNYALSRATYRYALKIDSDQVYFAEKLKRYCDAYRKEDKVSISLGDYFVKYYVLIYSLVMTVFTFLYPLDISFRISKMRHLMMKKYEKYLLKEIINNKTVLVISGINLGFEHGKWGIYVFNKLPFNGMGDSFIFRITKDTVYKTVNWGTVPVEVMECKTERRKGGWFWYHLQGMRKSTNQTNKEWISLTDRLKPIRTSSDWPKFLKYLWLFFWAYEKNIPDPDLLLTQTTKNLQNRK